MATTVSISVLLIEYYLVHASQLLHSYQQVIGWLGCCLSPSLSICFSAEMKLPGKKREHQVWSVRARQTLSAQDTLSCYHRIMIVPPSLFHRNETYGVSASDCTQRTTAAACNVFLLLFQCIESLASVFLSLQEFARCDLLVPSPSALKCRCIPFDFDAFIHK